MSWAEASAPVGGAQPSGKRRDIQVLRAIAVLLVVAYHLPGGWHLSGGFIGVDVFFAISGYVITESILRSSPDVLRQPRFFWTFMGKRCRRLVPALSVAVAATVVVILLFAPAAQIRGGLFAAAASLLFVSNIWFLRNFDSYWNPELAYSPLLHMWSLAVEFQVYLVFPLIFIVGLRLLRDRAGGALRRIAVAVAVLSLLSLAVFLYLLYGRQALVFGENPASVAFYAAVPRFWEFGVGAVIALLVRQAPALGIRAALGLKAVALVVAVASLTGLGVTGTIGWWVLPAIAATGVFLAVPTHHAVPFRPAAALVFVLVWVGDRSYSIYLWHWPLLVILIWRGATQPRHIFIALLLTLIAADLSYRLVEQGRWPTRAGLAQLVRLSRPAWAFGLALVVLAAAVVALRTDLVVRSGSAGAVATPFPPSEVNATDATLPMYDCGELAAETHCQNAAAGSPEIVVVGDSIGYRLLPAVQYVGKKHGLNVTMFWAPGCGIEFDQCPDNVRAYLESNPIAAIVIAQNFAYESVLMNGAERDEGLQPACDPAVPLGECPQHLERIRLFEERAAQGLDELTRITPNILMALPFPQQAWTYPACLTARQGDQPAEATDDAACGWTSVDWQRTRQGLFPEMLQRVMEPFPGVVLWDPVEALCADGRCPAVINDGEPLMDDAIHMTMEASRYTIPPVEAFVVDATGRDAGA